MNTLNVLGPSIWQALVERETKATCQMQESRLARDCFVNCSMGPGTGICPICNQHRTLKRAHIIPRKDIGERWRYWNILLVCSECHDSLDAQIVHGKGTSMHLCDPDVICKIAEHHYKSARFAVSTKLAKFAAAALLNHRSFDLHQFNAAVIGLCGGCSGLRALTNQDIPGDADELQTNLLTLSKVAALARGALDPGIHLGIINQELGFRADQGMLVSLLKRAKEVDWNSPPYKAAEELELKLRWKIEYARAACGDERAYRNLKSMKVKARTNRSWNLYLNIANAIAWSALETGKFGRALSQHDDWLNEFPRQVPDGIVNRWEMASTYRVLTVAARLSKVKEAEVFEQTLLAQPENTRKSCWKFADFRSVPKLVEGIRRS